jgi:hypothetical protein
MSCASSDQASRSRSDPWSRIGGKDRSSGVQEPVAFVRGLGTVLLDRLEADIGLQAPGPRNYAELGRRSTWASLRSSRPADGSSRAPLRCRKTLNFRKKVLWRGFLDQPGSNCPLRSGIA